MANFRRHLCKGRRTKDPMHALTKMSPARGLRELRRLVAGTIFEAHKAEAGGRALRKLDIKPAQQVVRPN